MINPQTPKSFKRGADFSVILALPSYVESGHFTEHTPTAQLRRYQNDEPEGLIAQLTFEWIDPAVARAFRLTASNTHDWPIGPAELDVLFTGPDGKTVATQTKVIKIIRGITKNGA